MILYVGNAADPAARQKIDIDEPVAWVVLGLAKPFQIDVFDRLTGRTVTLADEDCGLRCRCAPRFVERPRGNA